MKQRMKILDLERGDRYYCGCGDRATVKIDKGDKRAARAYCDGCAIEIRYGDVSGAVEQIIHENAHRSGGSSGRFHNDPGLDNAVRALEDGR